MEIDYRKLSEIVPYPDNPRINDAAVDAVAQSIEQFGFRGPILVDQHGVVIAGHTRLLAALKLGMTEVPVIVVTDTTPRPNTCVNTFSNYYRSKNDKVSKHCPSYREQRLVAVSSNLLAFRG